MSTAFDWIDGRLQQRRHAGLHRTPRVRRADDDALDLAGNDYLGLTRHPEVVRGAVRAAREWGAGSTGSRLVTGTTQLHRELEERLAGFCGAESALVFSSGYTANLAATNALTGSDTLIVSDRHNHASLIDGCRLSRAEVRIVPHRDVAAVRDVLSVHDGPALVVTESVFSVDGDTAPLRALHQACREHGAALLVDDAHGLGTTGPRGAGALHAAGLAHEPDVVVTATLSKSLGSQGGAVLGPERVIRHLTQTARTFIFDTGLAPACVGAALAALDVLRAEPERAEAVRKTAAALHDALASSGLPVRRPGGAVLSLPADSPEHAVSWAARCRDEGVVVGCFRPPSVPDTSSRLRLTSRADLSPQDITRAVKVIAGVR